MLNKQGGIWVITENGKGCKIIIVGPMCQGVGYVEIHSAEPVCYTVLKTYYGYFVCTLEDSACLQLC